MSLVLYQPFSTHHIIPKIEPLHKSTNFLLQAKWPLSSRWPLSLIMESFEEKKLRQEQEKLDKFGVDTHPSVRLKVRVVISF